MNHYHIQFDKSRHDVPAFQDQKDEINKVLSRFFDIMFPAAITFGAIALIVSTYRSLVHGWYPSAVLHIGMYLYALIVLSFRRRIPVIFLFYSMLGLICLAIIDSLLALGLASDALISLTVLCVFTGVFLGIRAGLVTLVLGVLIVFGIGIGICTGMIRIKPMVASYLYEPSTWILHIAFVPMYIVPLILSINFMRKRMLDSNFLLKKTNDQLNTEISRRTVIENSLMESEEKYRNIFKNSIGGIFQATLDGTLTNVNPSLARMAGFTSPEDMIKSNANVNQTFFADNNDRLQIRRILQEQGVVEGFEARMISRDGGIIWVSMNLQTILDQNGKRLFIEGSIEDITKRKAAEMALHESELKYRSVVENLLVGFYIVQDNFFKFVNPRFCAITGYSCDEVVDKLDPMKMIHPDDHRKVEESFDNRINGTVSYVEYELRLIKKDGMIITVKVIGSTLIYNEKKALFGTLIDITNEKLLEAKLLQAQKMEALGTLTGGIAHDFNNILTALMGYGTILSMKLEPANPLKHYAENILSASEKASNLIKSLLAFSRLQPVTLKPININKVIRDTEKLLRRLITEDITLVTDLKGEYINILADQTQIEQILFNLVANARDAMPRGGRLQIATRITDLGEEFIRLNGFGKAGKYAIISISDNGTGMNEDTKQKIFDPFFTTKDIGKGTGLGLSTVYGIVKQNRGYIIVESRPGEGADFRIYFPLIKEGVIKTEKLAAILREGRETILVAEDNNEARSFIKEILEHYGYRVVVAVDGDDAVNKFNEHKDISLVILDSIMPKKNGNEVYGIIKKVRNDICVLFMSGHTKDVVLSKGIMEPQVEFISKPLLPEEFLKKVGDLLERTEPLSNSQ